MLAVAATFSENGDGTWLETEALGYGTLLLKFDKSTCFFSSVDGTNTYLIRIIQ